MKRKLIIETITIPANTNPTTTTVEVTIDSNYRHLVGVAMFESSNPNNIEFLTGVSKGGNAIMPASPRALFKAEHASPDDKFKTLGEFVDISKVEVSTTLRVVSGAAPIVFDVILEFQDQE
jgi:hypothetical protein